MRASGCIVDDNAVLDQFAKTNVQAYHDEVVFFHVSNSSGLWFAPWLKWRRKLSFVHYCKTASPGARNVVWPCRRKKTKKWRRTTRRQHGFRIQTQVLNCLICLLLATNKRFWGLRKKVLLESCTKAMLQCSQAGLMWRDWYVLACGNTVEVRLRSLISRVFVNISSRIMVRRSQSP